MTSENVQAAQLIAEGPQDIWLTGDPQTSFFRSMYRRHVSYGMSVEKFNFNSDTVRFDRRGDLLGACYLTASDPVTNVQLSTFPISGFARVDLFIGGQLVDSQDTTFSSQVWPVTEATTWSERNVPSSFYPLHFFFCKDWSRAFPLVALEYHDIEVKIRDASSSYTFTLWAHMIHLSDQERAWYKRQPHRFLITQTHTARIDLQRDWGRFGGPIKYLAWPSISSPVPDAVTGFVTSDPTATTVDLIWNPALYATSYSIETSPSSTTQTTSGTILTFPDLVPDTEYTFTITPSNATGNGPPTTSDPISTLLLLPDAVTGFVTSNPTATTVDLIWNSALYATSYSIETSPPSTTQTTSGTTLTFPDLVPGTEYTFTITPSNASGNGPPTTSDPISTLPLPLPDAVTGFVTSSPTETTVDLIWSPALYATSYSIETSPPSTTQTTSGTTLTFPDLVPDTEYTFTITPSNATGNGPPTTSDPISTLLPLPGFGPTAGYPDPPNVTATTIDVVWFEYVPEYATSFNVYAYSVLDGLIGFENVSISSFSYTYTGLTPGTEYYFTVAGVNATGVGEAGGTSVNAYTLIQVNLAYTGTIETLNLTPGTYTFELAGGAGPMSGTGTLFGYNSTYGSYSSFSAEYTITEPITIEYVIGQASPNQVGGAGGTFIYDLTNSLWLFVAGGAGAPQASDPLVSEGDGSGGVTGTSGGSGAGISTDGSGGTYDTGGGLTTTNGAFGGTGGTLGTPYPGGFGGGGGGCEFFDFDITANPLYIVGGGGGYSGGTTSGTYEPGLVATWGCSPGTSYLIPGSTIIGTTNSGGSTNNGYINITQTV